MIVFHHDCVHTRFCQDTFVLRHACGHKRVRLGTNVCWHKRVWAQSRGIKHVWAQTCGLLISCIYVLLWQTMHANDTLKKINRLITLIQYFIVFLYIIFITQKVGEFTKTDFRFLFHSQKYI